jgi:hypothetical protein
VTPRSRPGGRACRRRFRRGSLAIWFGSRWRSSKRSASRCASVEDLKIEAQVRDPRGRPRRRHRVGQRHRAARAARQLLVRGSGDLRTRRRHARDGPLANRSRGARVVGARDRSELAADAALRIEAGSRALGLAGFLARRRYAFGDAGLGLAAAARRGARRGLDRDDDGFDAARRLGRRRPRADARRGVIEAFAGRSAQRALARALFRLSRHPRLRFDDDPSAGRHPFRVARIPHRSARPRAAREARRRGFRAAVRNRRRRAGRGQGRVLLDGPPTWIATSPRRLLIDGTFDAKKAIEAARAANGGGPTSPAGPRTIARSRRSSPSEDRGALGIADAKEPTAEIALGWQFRAR